MLLTSEYTRMTVAFSRWSYYAATTSPEIVLPDGCIDILALADDPRLHVTTLDSFPRRILMRRGVQITGFRLRPGTLVDSRALAALRSDEISDHLGGVLHADSDLLGAVEGLAMGVRPVAVASQLGVSLRSLQRRLRATGLPPPEFWALLGRCRLAAAALEHELPLAEIAADSGYSDQPHMTREFVRWFGVTPNRLRNTPAFIDAIRQPGLGNWTGEHISTK